MYIDSDLYLQHINDNEQIEVLKKVIDKLNISLRNYTVEYTDFLDPYQRRLAESVLNRIDDIDYRYEGGIEEAERKSIVIFPSYMDYDSIENPIKAVKVSGNFKFNRSSHSDYLGSVMGLGIKREKIGDIFSFEDRAYIAVSGDILDYVLANLQKIGRETVKTEEVPFEEIEYEKPETEEKIITVASERLDNFVSEIYNLSRTKASSLIEGKRVKVDFQPVFNKSRSVEEGSLISVRGHGRSVVCSRLGESRKGKIRYRVERYI